MSAVGTLFRCTIESLMQLTQRAADQYRACAGKPDASGPMLRFACHNQTAGAAHLSGLMMKVME